MPLNLSEHPGPLMAGDPDLGDVFGDLQGNILASHGRENALHLFLRFCDGSGGRARAALASLADGFLTSAQAQASAAAGFRTDGRDAGLFAHVALSAKAYQALSLPSETIPCGANPRARGEADDYVDAFGAGMKERVAVLQDPDVNEWDAPFHHEVHAAIILAADRAADIETGRLEVMRRFACGSSAAIADLVGEERGFVIRRRQPGDADGIGRSVEHFGFVDGISQPLLLVAGRKTEPPPSRSWDPSAPPRLVLVPDPSGQRGTSFGSFLVFRKLEQNVRGFHEAVGTLAAELGCSRALVSAMAVGRFADGTPVVQKETDGGSPNERNDFNYKDDPSGARCPFHAHIRKTNPRLESTRPGGGSVDADEERGHRIARRGISYGRDDYDRADPPSNDVGLLFMCYQSDIWEQFEFQQAKWSNNPRFIQPSMDDAWSVAPAYALGTGVDALIGQERREEVSLVAGPATPRNWPKAWDRRPTRTKNAIAHFVTMKGGEYFFSPSLSGLRNLARIDQEGRQAESR